MSATLLVLRLLFGILLLWHGMIKMSNFDSLVATFPDPLGLGRNVSLYMTIFAELFCSVGVIFGALFRLALVPIIVAMGVAFFVVHHGQAFVAKELALIFLAMFVLMFVMGAGSYSLDNVIATLIHRDSVAMRRDATQEVTHQQDSEHRVDDVPRQ